MGLITLAQRQLEVPGGTGPGRAKRCWLQMNFSEVLVLLAAGTLGGIFSAVVSIASLVSYPVLLALGVPPLNANMTNTASLMLTRAGSAASSRPELSQHDGFVPDREVHRAGDEALLMGFAMQPGGLVDHVR